MEYMGVSEASQKWGLSERRITGLCRDGRIDGALRKGRAWLIPEETMRPEDRRFSVTDNSEENHRPLPIGIDSYRELVTTYSYVDKSLLIRDILDDRSKVTLFTRPRRFGKTINMDMLKLFFEKSEEDSSVYFRDKKIWTAGEKYRREQGRYPVIALSFKDMKYSTWNDTVKAIRSCLVDEVYRHREILESEKIREPERKYISALLGEDMDSSSLCSFLAVFSKALHDHYSVPAIIIIDEYDTPVQEGFIEGYYEEAVRFMRIFFSAGLKGNTSLKFAFVTGILRVAKESIFSGLNNLMESSVLDTRYSTYFGFTSDEVVNLLSIHGMDGKFEEVCSWYDGYIFGESGIFNPWSVMMYLRRGGIPGPYWISTSSNDIIRRLVCSANKEEREALLLLLEGQTISIPVLSSMVYPEIYTNPSSLFFLLLSTGYLKVVDSKGLLSGGRFVSVAIPNKEIQRVYEEEIFSSLPETMQISTAAGIHDALTKCDLKLLQEHISRYLKGTVSYHDTSSEAFFHGLLLGLYAVMDDSYVIRSNRESGYGRFDIMLSPLKKGIPGIIVEVKAAGEKEGCSLETLADKALGQIVRKKYSMEFEAMGVKDILLIGMAFSGKDAEVRGKAARTE